jgi:hypothetical protein
MITNPVYSSPAVQHEAAVKAEPRQKVGPPQTPLPQDKVTLSPQAQAGHQAASTDKNQDGDSK